MCMRHVRFLYKMYLHPVPCYIYSLTTYQFKKIFIFIIHTSTIYNLTGLRPCVLRYTPITETFWNNINIADFVCEVSFATAFTFLLSFPFLPVTRQIFSIATAIHKWLPSSNTTFINILFSFFRSITTESSSTRWCWGNTIVPGDKFFYW